MNKFNWFNSRKNIISYLSWQSIISFFSIMLSLFALYISYDTKSIAQKELDLKLPSKLEILNVGDRIRGLSALKIINNNKDYAILNISINRQYRSFNKVKNNFNEEMFDGLFLKRSSLNFNDSIEIKFDSLDIERLFIFKRDYPNDLFVIIYDVSYISLPDKKNHTIIKYIFGDIYSDKKVIFFDYKTGIGEYHKYYTKRIDSLYKYYKVEEL